MKEKSEPVKNLLDTSEKIDLCKSIIQRIDNYYNGINQKCNFIVGFNTVLFVGIMNFTVFVSKNTPLNTLLIVLFTIAILSSLISTLIALYAISPFLKSKADKKDKPYCSILFFGEIASNHEHNYIDCINKLDANDLLIDFQKQTYVLSQGLTDKFQKIKISIFSFSISIILFLITILIYNIQL